jgi:hypothetical protein
MFVKKLLTTLLFVLLISTTAFSPVLAASANLAASYSSNRFGEVTKISGDTVTFKSLGGEKKTFTVNSSTYYYGINGVVKSASDMKKGSLVNAIGSLVSSNKMVAAIVILFPSSTNTAIWNNSRDYGSVTKVDKNAKTFVLSGRKGKVTYTVDSNTDFQSNVDSLSELKKGMTASLSYQETNSKLLVMGLIAWGAGTSAQPIASNASTVSKETTISFNKPADIWQGRTGVYFSNSAYSGEVTLTRQWTARYFKMERQLVKQDLALMDRYLDFQLKTSSGRKIDRLVGLVYVYFNLYPEERKLWQKGDLAIYTYDPDNQEWGECLANHIVRKGLYSYRLACIATHTGVYAIVELTE